MALSAYITTLKNLFGAIKYPITKTRAVYDDNNNRLDQTLAGINSDLASQRKGSNCFAFGQLLPSKSYLQSLITFANEYKAYSYRGNFAFEGIGYCSGLPTDSPGTGYAWQYATVKFFVRSISSSDPNKVDGRIVVYAWNTNQIATRAVANGAYATEWAIIGS